MTEQLREAIRASRQTPAAIARDTGVAKSVLSRFLNGADLRSDNLDRLAGHLDLRLVKRRQR